MIRRLILSASANQSARRSRAEKRVFRLPENHIYDKTPAPADYIPIRRATSHRAIANLRPDLRHQRRRDAARHARARAHLPRVRRDLCGVRCGLRGNGQRRGHAALRHSVPRMCRELSPHGDVIFPNVMASALRAALRV